MPVKIFATYSLKKDKPLGPLWGFFYGLGGQPNKLDPKSKDPEGQTQRAKTQITTAGRLTPWVLPSLLLKVLWVAMAFFMA